MHDFVLLGRIGARVEVGERRNRELAAEHRLIEGHCLARGVPEGQVGVQPNGHLGSSWLWCNGAILRADGARASALDAVPIILASESSGFPERGSGYGAGVRLRLATVLVGVVALCGCGSVEQRPGLSVGAVDDVVRSHPAVISELEASGFDTIAVTSIWEPGLRSPSGEELAALRAVAAEAGRRDVR